MLQQIDIRAHWRPFEYDEFIRSAEDDLKRSELCDDGVRLQVLLVLEDIFLGFFRAPQT